MQSLNNCFLLVLIIAQLGCSTAGISPHSNLKLADVENLKIGLSSKNQIIEKFGLPDKKMNIPDIPSEEAHLYFEGKFKSTPRLSLVFDKTSGLLQSITWWVRRDDPEYNLDKAQNRYVNVKFSTYFPKSSNPHVLSDEIIFQDKNSNLEITYLKTTKRVETISWTNPKTRSIAESTLKKADFEWSP